MYKIKINIDEFIAHPLLASLLITDFAVLLFHRPPALVSILMLSLLVYLSMFFGTRFASNNQAITARSSRENPTQTDNTSS